MNRQLSPPEAPRAAGFTVTELVAALAATGLLVALAVSAYRTYSVRAQIAATVIRSEPLMGRVAAAFARSGGAPRDATEAGVSADAAGTLGGYVDSVAVVDGRIDIRYGAGADPALAGQTLSLTPFETAAREVVWVCGNRLPGPGLEPLGFAGGGRQAVQVLTPINARYLPRSCR